MPSYSSYRDSVQKIKKLLVKETIRPLAFEHFEQETGTPVRQILPGNNQVYEFSIGKFTGRVITRNRSIREPRYDGELLSVNSLADDPTVLKGIEEEVYDVWVDIFGENKKGQTQIGHPGDPSFSKEGGQRMISNLIDTWELLCADPQITDLVGVIRDKNYRLATRFLGADNPEFVLSPGHGHEMYNLFMNGDISVIYQDSEIALLKPQYDRDDTEEVLEQQWNARTASSDTMVIGEQMRSFAERRFGDVENRDDITVIESDDPFESRVIRGEWPQEAFVVGVDDTQIGLFLHSIDGTRLDPTQEVTKEYIQDVMGFDRHYNHSIDRLDLAMGERIRLQGDLAMEYINGETVQTEQRLPIPIDNHYTALSQGILPQDESKETEPITVQVPDGSYLNIAHDEHTNVSVELAGGTYTFYLLHRGLQTRDERPNWEFSEMNL